ncbi:cation:proton antiporter [Herbidospora cretacea]|uniref:cation:proton antiporter n=1 Tax=Herbidospora cretacea TaxID=28444 RepID=UPI000A848262|nr:cation:proton antiporter [Herbidospora cretacea]
MPPLGVHTLLVFLLQVGVLLLAAVVLGRLAVRMKMPAVVGELCAGILLGPSLLAHVAPGAAGWLLPQQTEQFHLLDAAGQLGVLLLVGLTGSHLDFGLARKRGATAAKVSLFGLAVPLALGIGTGLLLAPMGDAGSDPTVFALFLGVAMCVSAIPVIAKTLFDMNLLHRDIGQLTLVAATVDDIFGWVMLSIVSVMATIGLQAQSVAQSLGSLLVVVVFAVVVARPLIREVFRRIRGSASVIGATVIIIVLSAAGTHALKLEAVFGAFVAVVGKFAGAYLGARTSRLSSWEGVALGACLNARGVIEVVIAMVGLRLGVLNAEMYTILILMAVLTSLMAPPILRLAMARLTPTEEELDRRDRMPAVGG